MTPIEAFSHPHLPDLTPIAQAPLVIWFELTHGHALAESAGQLYIDKLSIIMVLIVGVIGSGKDSDGVRQNLRLVGCAPDQPEPEGFTKSQRLAMLVGAAVWCGELSLMAAQTNPGELMSTHVQFERGSKA